MTGQLKGMLTYGDLEAILPYSRSYLRRLVSERKIPFYKFNRNVYFKPEEIDEWVAKKMRHVEEE